MAKDKLDVGRSDSDQIRAVANDPDCIGQIVDSLRSAKSAGIVVEATGGRGDVRSVLYMATVAAMRCNPVIRVFAQRLKKTGKAGKVVITARTGKLLEFLNVMVRDRLSWNQLKVAQ